MKYTDKQGNIRNTFEEVPDTTEATFVRDIENTEFKLKENEPIVNNPIEPEEL